ncbi:TetR/AcrR family transcriptional regulator [Thermaerobacter sp. PB12/4term]|uniref:TetR/AcrR family transcriptional regulator n=1 Tax=Thermaerobacter sp. PB12/4term TaxID=2293838 RepID=UPI000E32C582|nr:TetR/AcrR family transcriptional regulator [Thermaerobacter sp. PB12/4term]
MAGDATSQGDGTSRAGHGGGTAGGRIGGGTRRDADGGDGDGTTRQGSGGGTARAQNGGGAPARSDGGTPSTGTSLGAPARTAGTPNSGTANGTRARSGGGSPSSGTAGGAPARSDGGVPNSGTAGDRRAGGARHRGTGRRRAAAASARRNEEGTGPASTADASPRERILDAAVAEFADHGYLRASLSRIARRAGVAKSLVLYYFGSKDELYSAAVDRALQPIEAALEEAEPDLPRDLFERLRRLGAIKLQVYRDRPDAYRLIVRSMVDPAVSAEFRQRLAEAAARSQELLYRDVDTSRLRPGVTVEQAVELLMLVGDGLLPRIFAAIRQRPDLGYADLDQWVEKWERYLVLVRDGLYKPS